MTRRQLRRLFIAAAIVLICPLAARASCDTGAAPAYEDITYVKVSQFALVGQQHPWYTYEAAYHSVGQRTDVSLDAHRGVGMMGSLVSTAPVDSFKNVVQILEKGGFFAMRLQPSAALHLDGPEDSVTVIRCGITTTLSSVAPSQEPSLDDAQGKAFFALLADLRAAIFGQKWETPPGVESFRGQRPLGESPHFRSGTFAFSVFLVQFGAVGGPPATDVEAAMNACKGAR